MLSSREIFDHRGRRYFILQTIEADELSGDGGLFAFARTDVNINVNNLFQMEFALCGRMPGLLYVNGWPAAPGILYMPTKAEDGYWYGFFFDKLEYNERELRPGSVVPVRTIVAMVAKCFPLPDIAL